MQAELKQERQPTSKSIVWQGNPLGEARYTLDSNEQKLVIYAVAMIRHDDEEFKRYRINIAAFADAVGTKSKSIARELRDSAEAIARKPLIIPNYINSPTQKTQKTDIITHWFAEAEFGDGYVDVTFPPSLRPLLLKVKEEFFRYNLGVVMKFASHYAIRLYQWAKRWQFLKKQQVPIQQLRLMLGSTECDLAGNVISHRLPSYSDFRRWALDVAVKEINEASDIFLDLKENKKKGSKSVESITFTISWNPVRKKTDSISSHALKPPTQLVFLEDEQERLVKEIVHEFGLSKPQEKRVRACIVERGFTYIQEKVAVVRSEPRENAAKAFLAAVKHDWKLPVSTKASSQNRVDKKPRDGPRDWRYAYKLQYRDHHPEGIMPEIGQSSFEEWCLKYPWLRTAAEPAVTVDKPTESKS